jgi:hypothetical protein
MMVYIFGDLRQLRKFELSRPPISKPQPLVVARRRPLTSSPVPILASLGRTPVLPITQPPPLPVLTPPPQSHVAMGRHSSRSTSALSSASRSSSSSWSGSSEDGAGEIHISPAYFDEVFVGEDRENPVVDPKYAFPKKASLDHSRNATSSFAPTASFIHPYNHLHEDDDGGALAGNAPSPQRLQPLSAFNFDSLPPRSSPPPIAPMSAPYHPDTIVIRSDKPSKVSLTPRAILAYIQTKCNVYTWKASVPITDLEKSVPPGWKLQPTSLPGQPHIHRRRSEKSSVQVQAQFKMIQAVPAFASPLTRVLSPVVVRAQWEIVVRSAIVALFISWAMLGSLLAIPVMRR